jgi:hypothetical protein
MQNEALGHDTEYKELLPSTSEVPDHDDPLKVTALPLRSTAAQKVALGHDTEKNWEWPLPTPFCDHDDPL